MFNPLNLVCHRIPERTFQINGHYFPVCSRCTGFYLSLFSYFVYTFFNYVDYNGQLIAFAILLLLPSFFYFFSQLLGFRNSNNSLRFFTGILGGLGLGIIIKAVKWYLYIM